MLRFTVALALALSTSAAFAQMRTEVSNLDTLFIDLPYGEVLVTANLVEDYGYFVHAGGDQEVLLEGTLMPQWLETYENSALLRLDMGTAYCRVSHVWITYDEDGLRASDEFGTCEYDGEYAVTDEGPTYTMDGWGEEEVRTTFLFDPASNELIERY